MVLGEQHVACDPPQDPAECAERTIPAKHQLDPVEPPETHWAVDPASARARLLAVRKARIGAEASRGS